MKTLSSAMDPSGAAAFPSPAPSVAAAGASSSAYDGDASYVEMTNVVKDELLESFRPEFLNRLDEIIVFRALEKQEIDQVGLVATPRWLGA